MMLEKYKCQNHLIVHEKLLYGNALVSAFRCMYSSRMRRGRSLRALSADWHRLGNKRWQKHNVVLSCFIWWGVHAPRGLSCHTLSSWLLLLRAWRCFCHNTNSGVHTPSCISLQQQQQLKVGEPPGATAVQPQEPCHGGS